MTRIKVIFLIVLGSLALASASETIDQVNANYVIGGRNANPNQFPWQVLITINTRPQLCGGFILSDQFVGTAVNCVGRINFAMVNVWVGSNKRNQLTRYRVRSWRTHPRYRIRPRVYDLTVITMSGRIRMGAYVRPIKFPRNANIPDGMTVRFSGWGVTRLPATRDSVPTILQWKNTRTISNQQCQQRMPQREGVIPPEMLCTLIPGNKGSCHGDAGGCLIDQQGACIAVQSWHIPCASGYPDVYTKMWPLIPFIREVTQNSIPNLPQGPREN